MSAPEAALVHAARDRERGLLLSDRLNPLFVRDLQQSFAGRGFVVALLLALVGMLVVAAIALEFDGEARGAQALSVVLFAVGVMVNITVPLQAFQSTRQEMTGGTSEQLLLSSLTPTAIVRGKLLAAALKIVLWVSLFSPLVALTWLLRGLSVVQIALALGMAVFSGLAASSVAIVLGSLTVFRRMSSFINGLAALVLAGGGLALSSALVAIPFGLVLSGTGDMLAVLGGFSLVAIVLLVFCVLVARSQFMHAHENRSTAFRLFLPAIALLGWAWAAAVVPRGALDEALPVISVVALSIGVPFFVFAASEEPSLSPRVRLQVPASAAGAMRRVLFLPGGGRGLLWCVAMALFLTSAPGLIAAPFGVRLDDGVTRAANALALYGVGYAALGTLLRRLLPAGPAGSWWTRLIVLGVIVLGTVFSVLVAVLARGSSWNPLYLLNPVHTIVEHADGDAPVAIVVLLVGDILLLLLALGSMSRGCSEVAEASAARRNRAPAA